MTKATSRSATGISQQDYIAILFNDLGYTAAQKKARLIDEYGVSYSDELTVSQASALIAVLKDEKDGR